MAQTTGQISGKDVTIEVSTDDATYTDISGSSNTVTPGGNETQTGSGYTFGEAHPLVSVGPFSPATLALKIWYTEVTSEACALIKDWHLNRTLVYIRYRPKGSTAGNWQFKGSGYFTKPIFPTIGAEAAGPVAVDVDWFGAEIAQSTIT